MIRVLIADDHAMFREGVRAVLETEPDIEVVGETANGRETLARCQELKPDVILLDLDMPELDGLDVTRRLKEQGAAAKIIILTMFTSRDYAMRMLSAGAMAFVPKHSSAKILPEVIRAVMRGQVHVPEDMKDIIVQSAFGQNKSEILALSDRELQVLKAIAEGLTIKDIAEKYNISPRTVETHKARLTQKLGVKNKAELFKTATRMGLIKNF